MPKLKTKSSAKKRFRVTGNGEFKRKAAFRNHILTKMSSKRKRQLRGPAMVDKSDHERIERMLRGS